MPVKGKKDNMNIVKNVFLFFKRIFNKENDIKMLEAPIEPIKSRNKRSFADSLKINIEKYKRKRVETQVCDGDGLGIQTKISG